jgi:hypothetical protein
MKLQLHVQLFKVEEYGKDGQPKPPANRRVAEYDFVSAIIYIYMSLSLLPHYIVRRVYLVLSSFHCVDF